MEVNGKLKYGVSFYRKLWPRKTKFAENMVVQDLCRSILECMTS